MPYPAFLTRLRSDRSGSILTFTGIGFVTLIGAAGLAVDTAQWYLWKRQLQQAVDAGARAGALSMLQAEGAEPGARKEIGRNADNTLNVLIERVSSPPFSGAYTGDTGAVEVIATTSQKLPFSSVFLDVAPTIRARAVATRTDEGEYCVIALAPTGMGVRAVGTADVNLGCGVGANSGIQAAIDLTGTSWINAPTFHAVGGIDASSRNIPEDAVLQPYGLPIQDPLAGRELQAPSEPEGCTRTKYSNNPKDVVTLSPGRYCNGMTLKGNTTLSPGTYIIDGGSLDVASSATVTGDGVTFVLTGGGPGNAAFVKITGGATMDLTAPSAAQSPTWKNVLFFQDQIGSSSESNFAGGSELDLTGVIYMPNGDVRFTGNSGQSAECLLLVANHVTFAGTSSLNNNCTVDYANLDLTAPVVKVVE
ncbi:TadE/TadG family type IV pilus assembly protein [Novosphingobium mangrovi (ex Hu et al. 2023)]|uniref:Pilus assembly protein TadG-related protein n=1 Tax=Novosphingobium mangrovi (ex Hu et al. 2023) TaxID=2930094 RepID=A0ABT0AGW1_9SPHN|nr:TadE/TadG family type IV pilus assembly protein [Novosphingobium mangrovi (ex Hu et al. 2023)]MCJ1962415.1 pilus assembly protein TadG-related protein [Novosphingobium mangrovi (ex Hu et al. 2023)]